MSIVKPALSVAFAVFCVWLMVRIVNRRERWAKWTLAGLAVLAAYPLSLGPVVWLAIHGWMPKWLFGVPFYQPIHWIRANGPDRLCPENRVWINL